MKPILHETKYSFKKNLSNKRKNLSKLIKNKKLLAAGILAGLVATSTESWGLNPIFTTAYTADPAARVIDGRVYVFCSQDNPVKGGYFILKHRLYSSDDLANWTDHGPVVKLEDVPWANSYIWAPDWIQKGDSFYYCLPARFENETARRIGLLKSDNITGPYVSMKNYMELDGQSGADPSFFKDDDGSVYLFWSTHGKAKGVKMKDNMEEVDGDIKFLGGDGFLMEGVSVFKHKGTYYMTYASRKPSKRVQYLQYATATNPLGPYTYQGIYAQNAQGAPNIHQCHLELNGEWYTFYHDTSLIYDGKMLPRDRRSVRLDKMEFDEAGKIKPLVWTSTGPAPLKNLNPFETMLAVTGRPQRPEQTEWSTEGNGDKPYIRILQNGTQLSYQNCDFGMHFGDKDGKAKIRIKPLQKGKIVLHLDSVTAPPIAESPLTPSGDWQTLDLNVFRAVGVRQLILVFLAEEDPKKPICEFETIVFENPEK
jgi:arabinoxylan arabinofuranohydrolase